MAVPWCSSLSLQFPEFHHLCSRVIRMRDKNPAHANAFGSAKKTKTKKQNTDPTGDSNRRGQREQTLSVLWGSSAHRLLKWPWLFTVLAGLSVLLQPCRSLHVWNTDGTSFGCPLVCISKWLKGRILEKGWEGNLTEGTHPTFSLGLIAYRTQRCFRLYKQALTKGGWRWAMSNI